MATLPSRSDTAAEAIRALAPQVDRLFLFLDRFDKVPDYVRLPNVQLLRSQDHGNLGAAGKLLGLRFTQPEDVYLFADDDVCYPSDFGQRVAAALRGRYRNAVVGFHGSRLRRAPKSYLRDRRVLRLHQALLWPRRVDVVATCAGGLHCSALTVDVRQWPHRNMVDLQLALEARMRGMDAVLLPRRRNWIRFANEHQSDSIYAALMQNDRVQTELARRLMSA